MQPNAQPNQLSDHVICVDCLETSKHNAVDDTLATLESSTPEVRNAFSRMIQEHLQLNDEIFRYMNSRGWYNVRAANQTALSQVAQQYQQVQGSQGFQQQA